MAIVYDPNKDKDRNPFLDSLSGLMTQWSIPWSTGGDFNLIRFPREKKRGRYITSSMTSFSNFINDHELVNLPLTGRRFTWSNNQERVSE